MSILDNIEDQLTKTVKIDSERSKEMSLSEIVLDRTRGREYLNLTYPQEFEYYACALEITNADGDVLDFFSFPIMPQSMSESKSTSTNIKKTLGGVVVTNHTTFVPFDISLSGHFGRKMRKVMHKHVVASDIKSSDKPFEVGPEGGDIKDVVVVKEKMFSTDYKSGYACIKIIESMFERAYRDTDFNRKPVRMFFYNLSLNSNYLVEPINLQISQSRDSNMIWQYNMQLKAIAPAKFINKNYKSSLKNLVSYTKKYVRMTKQSNIINEMLKDVINGMTPVQSAMNQFGNYKALGEQSGIKLLKSLTDNPLENVNFIKTKK